MTTRVVVMVTVLGEAVPKGRPRAYRAGPSIRMFTPATTTNYEAHVRHAWNTSARNDARISWPATGAVELDVAFYRAPPKSMSKTRRAAALAGDVMPTTKPDLDNLVKSIKDALNGVAYRDDAQISRLSARKLYADQPRAIITLTALEGK